MGILSTGHKWRLGHGVIEASSLYDSFNSVINADALLHFDPHHALFIVEEPELAALSEMEPCEYGEEKDNVFMMIRLISLEDP